MKTRSQSTPKMETTSICDMNAEETKRMLQELQDHLTTLNEEKTPSFNDDPGLKKLLKGLTVEALTWEEVIQNYVPFQVDIPLYLVKGKTANNPKTIAEFKAISDCLPCTFEHFKTHSIRYAWKDNGVTKYGKVNKGSLKYHYESGRITHNKSASKKGLNDNPSGVYVFTDGRSYENGVLAYKIGLAQDLLDRVKNETAKETFVVEYLDVPYLWKTDQYHELECIIHNYIMENKVASATCRKNGREWFTLTKNELEHLNEWVLSNSK